MSSSFEIVLESHNAPLEGRGAVCRVPFEAIVMRLLD
jgi:hypothetical protein